MDSNILKLIEGLTEQEAIEFRARVVPTLQALRSQIKNKKKKETQMNGTISEKFFEIKKVLEKAAEARSKYRAAIAKLEKSEDFSEAYVGKKRAEESDNLRAAQRKAYEDVGILLSELQDLAVGKNKALDLADPAWLNALQLAQLGETLEPATAKQIVEHFSSSQPALRALKGVFQKNGVLYVGEFDNYMYDPEQVYPKLNEFAYSTFMTGAVSVNEFARELSRAAGFEQVEFPTIVDQELADMNIRRAAGLESNYVR